MPRAVARPTATRRARGLMDWLPVLAGVTGALGARRDVVVVHFVCVVAVTIARHHPTVTGVLRLGRRRCSSGGKRLAAAAVGAGSNFAQLQRFCGTVLRTCTGRRRWAGDQAIAACAGAATVVFGAGGVDAEHARDVREEPLALGAATVLAATSTPIRSEAIRAARLPLGD